MAFQVLGVAFLGNFLQVAEGKYMFGINAWQWLVCLLAGVGEIPWQQLINLVKRATSEKPGGGTRGGKFESGVLKFGSGRVWLHERTVQNTSAVRDVASSKPAALRNRPRAELPRLAKRVRPDLREAAPGSRRDPEPPPARRTPTPRCYSAPVFACRRPQPLRYPSQHESRCCS